MVEMTGTCSAGHAVKLVLHDDETWSATGHTGRMIADGPQGAPETQSIPCENCLLEIAKLSRR